jgi:hypothetical protein
MEHVAPPAEWTIESNYWRDHYRSRPYFSADRGYGYYEPAYRYGYESAIRDRGRSWDEAQRDLEREWNNYQLRGKLAWHEIQDAVRDAWDRATGYR